MPLAAAGHLAAKPGLEPPSHDRTCHQCSDQQLSELLLATPSVSLSLWHSGSLKLCGKITHHHTMNSTTCAEQLSKLKLTTSTMTSPVWQTFNTVLSTTVVSYATNHANKLPRILLFVITSLTIGCLLGQ